MLIEKRISTSLKPIPAQRDLGFGQHFSDHWFHCTYSGDKGWHNAVIEPYGKISLDPAASVLHYGQALFEGMKAFVQEDGKTALFRPDFNINRLQQGAARLCLPAPPQNLFMDGLTELLKIDRRWIPEGEDCSLYIRPTLIGTEAYLGVRPAKEVLFYILLSPVGSYYSSGSQPVKIWVEEDAVRAAPGGLGATKAGANYAASLQAALNAKEKGYSQVLWLDTARSGIEEVGTMNVFFVFKDEIVTPALNGSILAGGVRDSVLTLLRDQGLNVNERLVTIGEILARHRTGELLEAFGTGTAAVISPIGELHYQGENLKINQGHRGTISQSLLATLTGIQRGRGPDRYGWVVTL